MCILIDVKKNVRGFSSTGEFLRHWLNRYWRESFMRSSLRSLGKVGARSDVFTAAEIERFRRLSVKAAKIYGYE